MFREPELALMLSRCCSAARALQDYPHCLDNALVSRAIQGIVLGVRVVLVS